MMVTAEVWNINFCETRECTSYMENEIDSETVTDYDYKRARERKLYQINRISMWFGALG